MDFVRYIEYLSYNDVSNPESIQIFIWNTDNDAIKYFNRYYICTKNQALILYFRSKIRTASIYSQS